MTLDIAKYLDDEGVIAVNRDEITRTLSNEKLSQRSIRERYALFSGRFEGFPIYDLLKGRQRAEVAWTLERISDYLTILTDDHRSPVVLDLCCGTGLEAVYLADKLKEVDGKVIGIDFSPEMLSHASARVKKYCLDNVRLIQGNRDALPLARESLDAVVCISSMHEGEPEFFGPCSEVQRRWLWDDKFKAVVPVLKHSGIFVISNSILASRGEERWVDYHSEDAESSWRYIFENNGFDDVESLSFSHYNVDDLYCRAAIVKGRKK